MKAIKYIFVSIVLSCSIIFAQNDNLSNMHRLAKTFEQSGEYEQAEKIYEDLYKAQPWNTSFLESLNNVYIALKKYEKSIELLNEKIKSEPANVNLYGILGDTYYTQGDTTKAFQTWDEGINAAKRNFVGYRVIVNHTLQNRAFNKAIKYLKEGKKKTNNPEVFALDLARVYSITMNFEKAALEYCMLVQKNPSMSNVVLTNMSQYLTRSQAVDETIQIVEDFADNNSEAEIYRILIHLYKLKGDYQNAMIVVEKLETEVADDGKELFKFAKETLNAGEYDIASKAYEELINKFPNSPFVPAARIGYAKSFEQSINSRRDSLVENWKPYYKAEVFFEDQYKEIIQSYQKIGEIYSNNDIKSEALFRIADIYYEKLNDPDTAVKFYEEVLNNNAISQFQFDSRLKIAEINIRDGRINEAENEIKLTIENFNLPDELKSKANLLLGKVYFWKGNFTAALEKLTEVTQNLFDDNANDALQLATLISTLKQDSTNLVNYSAAELLAFQQKYSEAEEKFMALINNQNPIVSELAGLKYGQVLIAQGKYNVALEELNKTIEESSLNMFEADILYLIGQVKFYALKDYDGALKAYTNVLENYSNSLYFDNSRKKIEYINELKKKSI